MAVEVTLRFTPDSLADYDDSLTIVTQLGRLVTPLRGRRHPPALSLPGVIEMGDVLLGNTRRVQVGGLKAAYAQHFAPCLNCSLLRSVHLQPPAQVGAQPIAPSHT